MNLYHCMIELKHGTRAMAFAAAAEAWMEHLRAQGMIRSWRLLRRKLGLASGAHSDLLLEVEVENLASLDEMFRLLAQSGDEAARRYDQLHQMIARAEVDLYRPYPDPEQRERIALI